MKLAIIILFKVYLIENQDSTRLIKTVSIKIGFFRSGLKIHRGYNDEALALDKLPEVSHLVFVVHGVGQYMLKKNLTKEGDIISSALT